MNRYIKKKHVQAWIFFQALFSLLLKYSTLLRGSLSSITYPCLSMLAKCSNVFDFLLYLSWYGTIWVWNCSVAELSRHNAWRLTERSERSWSPIYLSDYFSLVIDVPAVLPSDGTSQFDDATLKGNNNN